MAPAFLQAAPRQLVRVDVVQLVAALVVMQLVAASSAASTWEDNAAAGFL